MIQVSGLAKSFGGRVLFSDITFALERGEIAGLVGRNGSGKSTLFKILLGQESHDHGDIVCPKGYKLGHLDQHIRFSKPTVLEECCQVLSDDEQFDHFRAERILFGLGFDESDMQKNPQQFSGGYQLRINLTKALLKNPDLLLLDEPTNYLDIVSLRWLRRFLKSFRGEVILITHDREFMDAVTTHTMGLHRGKLKRVKGDSEKYYQQLLADEEIYEKTRRNQEKKMKDMQAFVDRFRAKASKAKQAQSKLKQMQKLTILEALDSELTLGLHFNYKSTPAKTLLEADGLGFSYSQKAGDMLFKNLSFHVKPGECVAVVGKNGKGKSTLLNLLAGRMPPTVGQLRMHPGTAVGYYQQTHRKDLRGENTVAQEIALSNSDLSVSQVRAICGAMMFSGDVADKKISVLSGGEQGRVLLGKILAYPANLLLLDEPSNHLDMDSIEVLTEELSEFSGGVIIVTHNEEMLRRLATKLIVFRQGGAEVFLGTYDEFLQKLGWDDEAAAPDDGKGKSDSKQKRRARAELIGERSRVLRPLEKEVKKVEEQIRGLESILDGHNQEVIQLIQANAEGSQIQDLYKTIGGIQLEIEAAYTQMEKLMQELDGLNADFDRRLKSLES